MSTRLSFRCCKNGLAVFFLAVGWTKILRAAGFGATLGPDGGYSVAFQGLFSSLFGKIVALLTWEGFYICDPNNWVTQKLVVNMEHFGRSCKFPCASRTKVVV